MNEQPLPEVNPDNETGIDVPAVDQPAPEGQPEPLVGQGDAPPDMPGAVPGDTYNAAVSDFVKAYIRSKSVNGQLQVNAAEIEIKIALISTELEVVKDFIAFNLPGGRATLNAAIASAYRARIQGMEEAPRIQVAR